MSQSESQSQAGTSRRLIRHGMFLFLLGLLTGILIPTLTSPRLALAAHMEGLAVNPDQVPLLESDLK